MHVCRGIIEKFILSVFLCDCKNLIFFLMFTGSIASLDKFSSSLLSIVYKIYLTAASKVQKSRIK